MNIEVEKILISACLLGAKVRYDGSDRKRESDILSIWHDEGRLISICPEVAAGLPTPRDAAEISREHDGLDVWNGAARVMEEGGADRTEAYVKAGQLALQLAKKHDCRFAILTDGSPSCGSTFIYDGSFTGRKKPGRGATAALLEANGIRVFAETEIENLAAIIALG